MSISNLEQNFASICIILFKYIKIYQKLIKSKVLALLKIKCSSHNFKAFNPHSFQSPRRLQESLSKREFDLDQTPLHFLGKDDCLYFLPSYLSHKVLLWTIYIDNNIFKEIGITKSVHFPSLEEEASVHLLSYRWLAGCFWVPPFTSISQFMQ